MLTIADVKKVFKNRNNGPIIDELCQEFFLSRTLYWERKSNYKWLLKSFDPIPSCEIIVAYVYETISDDKISYTAVKDGTDYENKPIIGNEKFGGGFYAVKDTLYKAKRFISSTMKKRNYIIVPSRPKPT